MAIYLVRHGVDDEGYRGGWSQRGLVTEGYRQSEKLGSYLKESRSLFNIHHIISSDLQRALDTANELARELEIPVQCTMNWREMNNGIIAGMPNEIVDERYPSLYFSGLQMEERYPGGESPLEFFNRIRETFTKLCAEQASSKPEENVIVVTHGGVINIIYHLVNGLEWTNRSPKFPSSYTSLHKIELQDGKWMISMENQTAPASA